MKQHYICVYKLIIRKCGFWGWRSSTDSRNMKETVQNWVCVVGWCTTGWLALSLSLLLCWGDCHCHTICRHAGVLYGSSGGRPTTKSHLPAWWCFTPFVSDSERFSGWNIPWPSWGTNRVATAISGHYTSRLFCGVLSKSVYCTLVHDIISLHRRISDATPSVNADMLERIWQELEYQLDIPLVTNCAHVEILRYLPKLSEILLSAKTNSIVLYTILFKLLNFVMYQELGGHSVLHCIETKLFLYFIPLYILFIYIYDILIILNKIVTVYCSEYTDIPNVFFTARHICRCCTNAIWGHCCVLGHSCTNVILDHCCMTSFNMTFGRSCTNAICGLIVVKNATDRNSKAHKVFFAHAREWRTLNNL
jgi:hypothetical protein